MARAIYQLDHLQEGPWLWMAVAVIFVGDLFCTFDHSAPWAKVFFAGSMLVLCVSALVRGAWRLRLFVRPAVATIALFVAAFMFAFGPSLIHGRVGWLINMISALVGVLVWWSILEVQRPRAATP